MIRPTDMMFETYPEIDPSEIFGPDTAGEAWEVEASRASPDYIRWVQQSLNKIMSLRLGVDGIMGPATRSAIRSFQQIKGLAADGIVGPRTEAALRAALGATPGAGGTGGPLGRADAILERFGFDSDRLQPFHAPLIEDVARRIVASQSSDRPVRSIQVIGHTDPVGSETYNRALGQRRANQVAQALRANLEGLRPGLSRSLAITVDTRGETQTVPGDAARSRRVEVFLSAAAQPVPPTPQRLNPARWVSIMSSPELRTGNFVNYLVDGRGTFRAMHTAILTANSEQHYIYLLGWWLTDDLPLVAPSPGTPATIRDLFADASRRGVQIRAMLWDQWGAQNSAEVQRINGLATGAAILDNHTSGRYAGANVGSHHQKVLVVKGERGLIAFCGGVDINRDRVDPRGGGSSSSGGAGSPMHDVHCRIVGPSAHDLLATFIRRWDAHPDHGAIDGARGDLLGRREPLPAPLSPVPIDSGSTGGNCAVRIARTYNPVLPLAPGTTAIRERSIRQTLGAAINNAQRFIYMEDQYLVNMEAAALLNGALSRIEHLTIVMPDSSISDMPRIWEARLSFLARVTAGPHGRKVRVFILSTPPNRAGTPPVFGDHTYVHAKTWIFDDELAVIGSANCNQRGWTHDSELNAVIFEDRNPSGQTFAQRLRMALWAEHLNVSPGAVADGVASAPLWTAPPAGARIRPYDPRAGTDSWSARQIPWGVIDPAGPP
ncbi:MAG: peptidoglycan-binding protein [Chloroflexi bacterium]|nr:peptidoglycan-binding protein [Chloroflexota bacterium]